MFILVISSCAENPLIPAPSSMEPVAVVPYRTPTASQTPGKFDLLVETPTQLPTPTQTPVVYSIVEGDTMLAIAFRYGISLEELQAANPEVNARLLVVGTELIIPLEKVIPSNPFTATPIPVEISQTNCYLAPDGIWCFVIVKNDRSRPLENLSANVVLQDNNGEYIAEGIAIGALNLVPADEQLPLVVFIPGSFPSEFTASAKVITVQPLPRNDDRYLNAWLEVEEVEISENGTRAQVNGFIGLPTKSVPGNQVWLLAVAYDGDGNVIGIRKSEQFGNFEPGSSREINLEVFSLASEIAEVRVYVEMRP